jgi:hypothetical protein
LPGFFDGQAVGSVLFGEHLRLRFSVWMETGLLAVPTNNLISLNSVSAKAFGQSCGSVQHTALALV